MMRRGFLLFAVFLSALAVSCGGGGGSSSGTSGSGSGGTVAAQVAACEATLPQLTIPASGNTVPVIVDSGPCGYGVPYGSPSGTASSVFVVGSVNQPYTSVTICSPSNPSNCQTVDHVLIDTGSSGLRIMSSVLNSSLSLPAVTVGNAPLFECVQFASSYSWGSVRSASVKIGGESAGTISVHVIGDSSAYSIPSACTSSYPTPPAAQNDVVSFQANGVLGVGLFVQDCGPACAPGATTQNPLYYTCPTTNCTNQPGASVPLSQQVSNPVSYFTTDNTGVILQMPALAAGSGVQNMQGTLVFGINTANNNTLTSAQGVYPANGLGDFNTTFTSISTRYAYTSTPYSNSFIDSGSNGFYVPGTTIPTDTTYGWFNPGSPVTVTATVQGASGTGASTSISFQIVNYSTLFALNSGSDTAVNGLGAPNGGTTSTGGMDWGLPFFFGRSVYIALEGTTLTASGSVTPNAGPFWAF